MIFADNILHFLLNLHLPFKLPEDIEVLDAHQREDVQHACTAFYKKYYYDNNKRHLLLGINPEDLEAVLQVFHLQTRHG